MVHGCVSVCVVDRLTVIDMLIAKKHIIGITNPNKGEEKNSLSTCFCVSYPDGRIIWDRASIFWMLFYPAVSECVRVLVAYVYEAEQKKQKKKM